QRAERRDADSLSYSKHSLSNIITKEDTSSSVRDTHGYWNYKIGSPREQTPYHLDYTDSDPRLLKQPQRLAQEVYRGTRRKLVVLQEHILA
ncbi:hypothetical protein IRJ41_024428, partial [Triplophysa rosa]